MKKFIFALIVLCTFGMVAAADKPANDNLTPATGDAVEKTAAIHTAKVTSARTNKAKTTIAVSGHFKKGSLKLTHQVDDETDINTYSLALMVANAEVAYPIGISKNCAKGKNGIRVSNGLYTDRKLINLNVTVSGNMIVIKTKSTLSAAYLNGNGVTIDWEPTSVAEEAVMNTASNAAALKAAKAHRNALSNRINNLVKGEHKATRATVTRQAKRTRKAFKRTANKANQ